MFEFLFFDLDDTLLDFHKAEAIAVAKAFRDQGLEPTPDLIRRYSQVNKLHWEMLERGELTREQVLVQRFAFLFRELGLPASPEGCQDSYENYLCMGHYFVDGALELLQYLSPKYRLFLASNGTARVQESRLKSAGIGPFFENVFISQHLGANKPERAFFEACFAAIDGFDRSRALIIGDSLTSDIRGGNNAGIQTCWFNPRGAAPLPGIHVDYEVHRLEELKTIL
ncbi:MAG: YjjG family noncanonical pyrimidine nucleotidase [Candidatus Faecousia sp.]|nr:YjjG family noncanonical pyrimidine nucleotidase [Bacillota bacterium]MDY4219520.1 YjjG family noncanonical pyrimidine nucleotidase [Candidatus Faecousia sp.]